MKELLQELTEGLVTQKDAIQIEEERNKGYVNLRLLVAEEDMGRVIGKDGRIANAIRQLLKAAAIKENVKVSLKIDSNHD